MNDTHKDLDARAAGCPGAGRLVDEPRARRPRQQNRARSQIHSSFAQQPMAQQTEEPGQKPQRDSRGRRAGSGKFFCRSRGYRFADVVSGQLDQDETDTARWRPPNACCCPSRRRPNCTRCWPTDAGMGSRLEMELSSFLRAYFGE